MESMKYSDTAFPVSLDPAQVVAEVHANTVNLPKRTVREHIEYALDHPIGAGAPLGGGPPPGTRSASSSRTPPAAGSSPAPTCPSWWSGSTRPGIPDKDILILCATGTHRQQTEKEHISLVGEDLYRRIQFRDHNCDDKEPPDLHGHHQPGTPVWLNSYAMACDKIILTGGVVYHFHGRLRRRTQVHRTGHRRPGDHQHQPQQRPEQGAGQRFQPQGLQRQHDGQQPLPQRPDGVRCLRQTAYLLNVIVDDNYQIVGAFAGDCREAHAAAAKVVEQLDGVPIPRRTPAGHRQRRRLPQGHQPLPDLQDPLQRSGGGGPGRHDDSAVPVPGGLR